MVPGGRREPAWSIPYLEVQDLEVQDLEVQDLEVQDLEVQDLEVRAVSRSKRRLQSNAMPFRGHGHSKFGRCEFSSGAPVAL
jgi:hypothetical protein